MSRRKAQSQEKDGEVPLRHAYVTNANIRHRVLKFLVVLLFLSIQVRAGTHTWTGDGAGSSVSGPIFWSDNSSAQWVGGPPDSIATISFNAVGETLFSSNNLSASIASVQGLTLNSSSQSVVILGSGFLFTGTNIRNLNGTRFFQLGNLTNNIGDISLNATTTNIQTVGNIRLYGNLTQNSSGLNITKNGTNSFSIFDGSIGITGNLRVNQGDFIIESGGSVSSAASLTTNSSGTFHLNSGSTQTFASISGNGTIRLSSGSIESNQSSSTTYSGNITGSGGLIKSGNGDLTLSSATSNYTGVTTLNSGTLSFATIANGGVASAIGQSSSLSGNLVLNGGVLRYTGNNATTDRGFTVGGSASINVTTAGRTLNFSGSTNGGGTLTKVGSGTLQLSGGSVGHANTAVSAGTLLVTGSLSGGVTVDGGTLAGNGTIGGLTTLNSGATLTPGNGVGTINLTGGLVTSGNITMQINGTTAGQFDTVAGAGSINYGGNLHLVFGSVPSVDSQYALFTGFTSILANFASISVSGAGSLGPSDMSFNPSTGTLTVIPEPGTLALFGIGASFLLWRVRRRHPAQR